MAKLKKSSLFKTINMFSFSIFPFWIFMNVWNEFIILIFFPDCTIFSSRMTTFEIRFFPRNLKDLKIDALMHSGGPKFIIMNRNPSRFGLESNRSWRIGILFPELFWPFMRKNCSSNQEKLLKFEAEGREFEIFLRSLKLFIQTAKELNNFWNKMLF